MTKIELPQGAILCETAGQEDSDRPVLVLLHGIQGTAAAWEPVMKRLADRWRIVAPNLRGRGGSLSPSDPRAYRLDLFAGDLRAVLAAQNRPACLVGWSMGVSVALDYWARFGPGGLCGLVLVSGSSCLSATGGADARWFHGTTVSEVAAEASARAIRLGLTATATPEAVAGSWMSVRDADYRPILGSIDLPTLILHGADDDQCPAAHAEILERGIPGAALDLWAGCGHNPMAFDPDRFAARLDAFARGLAGATETAGG